MQLRKVKIMKIKASLGPLKVWGPRGSIPCSPRPSRWACWEQNNSLVNRNSQRYHYLRVCIWAMDHQGMVKTSLSFLQSRGDRFEVCSLLLCQNTLDRLHVWECGSCNWQGHPLPVPPGRLNNIYKKTYYAASWLVHEKKRACEVFFCMYFKLGFGLLRSLVPRPHLRERVWWHPADTLGFINFRREISLRQSHCRKHNL